MSTAPDIKSPLHVKLADQPGLSHAQQLRSSERRKNIASDMMETVDEIAVRRSAITYTGVDETLNDKRDEARAQC